MATSPGTSLVKRYEDLRSWFSNPQVMNQLVKIAPSHVNVQKILETAFQLVKENSDLLECEKKSVIAGIMGGLELGLSFKKELGQAYLVPFKRAGVPEAQLIIGYRGYITLAKNSGEVSKVSAHAVYANDQLEVEYGTDEKLVHIPAEGDRGDFKGSYVVFFYKDGTTSFEYMGKKTIDAHRARSKAKDSGPWVSDYDEMAVKTVVRHHAKFTPLSTERLSKAADLEERLIDGLPQTDLLPDIGEESATIVDAPPDSTTPPPEVSKFDGLLTEFIKGSPYEGMSKEIASFLEFLANKNKAKVDDVKKDASSRWDQFVPYLKKHLDEKMKPAKEKKAKEEAPKPSTAPAKEIPAGNVAQPSGSQLPLGGKVTENKVPTITCPETDGAVDIRTCETCPSKEGCSAQ